MTIDPKSKSDSLFDLSQRAVWAGETQVRRRRFRKLISLSHHITFALGKFSPKTFPMVFVLGYPKSGTTWISHLVADCLRLPFPQHSILPIGCPALVHGHETVTGKYPHGIYIVRDGRDVMISGFHHLKTQFVAGAGSRKNRQFFRTLDLDLPLNRLLPQFIEYMVHHPFGCRLNWGQHVESYFDSGNRNLTMIRYEQLLSDPVESLGAVLLELSGNRVDEARVSESVERYSFSNRTGRSKGQEDSGSSLRKGQSGDWKNHFDHESATVFNQHFGKALIKAGYEQDASWVDRISSVDPAGTLSS